METSPNSQETRDLSAETLSRRIRDLLPELRDRYHVLQVAIFGSRTRSDATPASDLDLLVTFDSQATLFDLIELEHDLTGRFGVPVDVVTPSSIKPRLRDRILKSAVPV